MMSILLIQSSSNGKTTTNVTSEHYCTPQNQASFNMSSWETIYLRNNTIDSLMRQLTFKRSVHDRSVAHDIIGKTVANTLKSNVKHSGGSLQLYTGEDSGCEAAVHTIHSHIYYIKTEIIFYFFFSFESYSHIVLYSKDFF